MNKASEFRELTKSCNKLDDKVKEIVYKRTIDLIENKYAKQGKSKIEISMEFFTFAPEVELWQRSTMFLYTISKLEEDGFNVARTPKDSIIISWE